MYKIERSALVVHSAENMFALVNDIDSYAKFLPWCGGSRILTEEANVVTASVDIAFKGIKKSFTTRNTQFPYRCTELQLVDGPFSELQGRWSFSAIEQVGSRISLELEFGFSNPLVGGVVGPVFKIIADSMVDAFCRRADEIYVAETESPEGGEG